jgi:hypothetical protein
MRSRGIRRAPSARQSSYRLSRIKGFGVRQYGERGSVGDAKLAINVVQVDLHRPLGQSQPPPYFSVRNTLGEHEHDLVLAGRERGVRRRTSFCGFVETVKVLHRISPGAIYTKPMAPTARSSYWVEFWRSNLAFA